MSSRRIIVTIVSIVLVSFLLIVTLYVISDKPLMYSQNFKRVIQNERIEKMNVLDLSGNSYYIAGVTDSRIFFGNRLDSLDLLVTNEALSNPQHIRLSVGDQNVFQLTSIQPTHPSESLILKDSRIEIDSPFFYIKAGNLPGIFRGTVDQWQAKRVLDSLVFFDQAVPIAENSFAFMAIGNRVGSITNQNILCKLSAGQVHINPKILEGQVDNFFSTRGALRYSKKLNRLIYTYGYRNEYLVIDTSLNLQYKGNTIDTVSQAHIKPTEVAKGIHVLASTPAIVNLGSQVYEDLLFIHSNLMASNETQDVFDSVSVIDVYNIKNGKYLYSFYIPAHNSYKMRTFKVTEDKIIAIYDNFVTLYSFTSTQSLAMSKF